MCTFCYLLTSSPVLWESKKEMSCWTSEWKRAVRSLTATLSPRCDKIEIYRKVNIPCGDILCLSWITKYTCPMHERTEVQIFTVRQQSHRYMIIDTIEHTPRCKFTLNTSLYSRELHLSLKALKYKWLKPSSSVPNLNQCMCMYVIWGKTETAS